MNKKKGKRVKGKSVNDKKKQKKSIAMEIYTLMFLLMCIAAFLPFFTEGKSFVWGAGVEDGLSQHFSALAYYGEALREFFP